MTPLVDLDPIGTKEEDAYHSTKEEEQEGADGTRTEGDEERADAEGDEGSAPDREEETESVEQAGRRIGTTTKSPFLLDFS